MAASKKNYGSPVLEYGKRELIALSQTFEFAGDVKIYLSKTCAQVKGVYLADDGISAGVFEFSDEDQRVTAEGIKVDVELGITARNGNLGTLVNNLLKQFPQFKEKKDAVLRRQQKIRN